MAKKRNLPASDSAVDPNMVTMRAKRTIFENGKLIAKGETFEVTEERAPRLAHVADIEATEEDEPEGEQ